MCGNLDKIVQRGYNNDIECLQGDIVKILNTSGTVVATYTYDAWGKVTNSGNVVGQYNPIRYRGYYYDTDTGFYYLQSRYYDPAIKRFINSDDTNLIGANGDFISLNPYTYCLNNPILMVDSSGELGVVALCIIGATIGGLIEYSAQVIGSRQSGQKLGDAWKNVNAGKIARALFQEQLLLFLVQAY